MSDRFVKKRRAASNPLIAEQLETDIAASHQALLSARVGTEKIQKELTKLNKEVEAIEVSP